IRDITRRKQLEAEERALAERLQQTQKLESLAVLAGGVAHDFNNILTVISNGVTLATRAAAVGGDVAPHLEAVAHASERARELCRQMLAYAGKGRLVRETLDLNTLVHEMSSMLEVSTGKKATLVRDLSAAPLWMLGDATQIRQILMNLVVNASEAISGS